MKETKKIDDKIKAVTLIFLCILIFFFRIKYNESNSKTEQVPLMMALNAGNFWAKPGRVSGLGIILNKITNKKTTPEMA